MAKKEFTYKGFKVEELESMSVKEFAEIAPARVRRTIARGFTDAQKIVFKEIEKGKKEIKTHCRDLVIVPSMINLTFKIHTGKEFFAVIIQPEMVGHYLGEFALSRRRVAHSSPGVGATKSSSNASVK